MIVLIYEGCGQLSKNKQLLLGFVLRQVCTPFRLHSVENTYYTSNAEGLH